MRHFIIIATLATMGGACSGERLSGNHGSSDASLPALSQTLTTAEVRTRFRDRIDKSIQLKLGSDAHELPSQQLIDISRFREVLGATLSSPVELKVLDSDSAELSARSLAGRLRLHTRYTNFVDSRGYADSGEARASEEELIARSEQLLKALSIDPSEGDRQILGLGAAGQESGQRPERVGEKAFYFRKLGGIPVGGCRMVFSYAPDGSLRHIRGWWPAIDFGRSYLKSDLTSNDVIERAVDALIAAKADPNSIEPIRVATFFEVSETDFVEGRTTVRLRARALVQSAGPNGPGRGTRFEFDI